MDIRRYIDWGDTVTQKELREKIRIEERRKCRDEINELKYKNRKLLNENINLRTVNAKLRAKLSTPQNPQDWLISLMRLYGL